MEGSPEKALGFTSEEDWRVGGGEEEEEVAGGQDEMGDNTEVKEHILYNEGLFLELLGRLKKNKGA